VTCLANRCGWRPCLPVLVAAAALLAVSACSSGRQPVAPAPYSSDAGAPQPATAPYLLMSDRSVGLAVWPSGHSWLLLRTTDGWKHVKNHTPVAVPTGGGLVTAVAAESVAVAIGPYKRLTQSPVLTGRTTGVWRPTELPGGVSNARTAVSLAAGQVSAVLAEGHGTAVVQAGDRWTRLTDASSLAPQGGLRLDGITWASDTTGWLTGHGQAGTAVAFQTTDAGQTWSPLPQATGDAVAVLAPCGEGAKWLIPIVTNDGIVRLEHTEDGGTTWATGAPVSLPSGLPAWGCHEDEVWMAGRAGPTARVFASNDAGATWVDAGAAPRGLTDLAPTGNGNGFAASSTPQGPRLWSVTTGGARFTSVALPRWVATVGSQMTNS
jgi:hypothetical protein